MATFPTGLADRPTRGIDPALLARVSNLEWLARRVVDGFVSGLHRAPAFGTSMDFAEHRGYVPGDDLRRLDWRLYARTDRYFLKQYDADTNTNVTLLLDVSASMQYGSHAVTKLTYARALAACLAYLASRQRDRIGLTTFDHALVTRIPPSAKHLDLVLHALDRAEATRPGAIARVLTAQQDLGRRRGLVVLISDAYEAPDVLAAAVRPFCAQGHDLVVFHLLDPQEVDFAFDDATVFEDLESGERHPVHSDAARDAYRQRIRAHIADLSRHLLGMGADYVQVTTAQPLDAALAHYLGSRAAVARAR